MRTTPASDGIASPSSNARPPSSLTAVSSNGTPEVPPPPSSGQLGDFTAVFSLLLKSQPAQTSRKEVSERPKTSEPLEPAKPTRPLRSPPVATQLVTSKSPKPQYPTGFFDGLSLSTLDTSDDGEDDEDDEDDGTELEDEPGNGPAGNVSGIVIARASQSPTDPVAAAMPTTPSGKLPVNRTPLTAGFPTTPVFSPTSFGRYPFSATDNTVAPFYLASRQEKLDVLREKLHPEYKSDAQLKRRFPESSNSIHVFVDLSNIVIGFYSRIRMARNIPTERKMRAPPFFFEAFAKILERGRPAARRVTAGSAPDNNNRNSWPVYMREAEALGYEMNILSRVTKSVPLPKARPFRNGGHGHRRNQSHGQNGYHSSDLNSSDDGATPTVFKVGEQGVDEILHLKMCHSFLDHDPGTIVLATGDAAAAEFSDGFLKHVERALGRDWCVELLSWKSGISYAWRELQLKQKDTGRFRIIELDKYVEELLAIFID